MTGVTVPQWGAILMLRSLKSPETYFQAAFRVQSPGERATTMASSTVRKPTCYVFEFDPNRALSLVAEYGIRLSSTGDRRRRGDRAAPGLPADLRVLRRRDAQARRRRRARLGHRRDRRHGPGAAMELAATG